MVCGLDLNNPQSMTNARTVRPSIAALACSNDKNAACYNMIPALSSDATYATFVHILEITVKHFCLEN